MRKAGLVLQVHQAYIYVCFLGDMNAMELRHLVYRVRQQYCRTSWYMAQQHRTIDLRIARPFLLTAAALLGVAYCHSSSSSSSSSKSTLCARVRGRKGGVLMFPVTLVTLATGLGQTIKFNSPNPLLFNSILTTNSIFLLATPYPDVLVRRAAPHPARFYSPYDYHSKVFAR